MHQPEVSQEVRAETASRQVLLAVVPGERLDSETSTDQNAMLTWLQSLLFLGLLIAAATLLGLHCLCCPDQMCTFFGLP